MAAAGPENEGDNRVALVTVNTMEAWDLHRPVPEGRTCLLSFSRHPCNLMSEPGDRSTTVRHRSMCFTDFSFVKAHSWKRPQLEACLKSDCNHLEPLTQDPRADSEPAAPAEGQTYTHLAAKLALGNSLF